MSHKVTNISMLTQCQGQLSISITQPNKTSIRWCFKWTQALTEPNSTPTTPKTHLAQTKLNKPGSKKLNLQSWKPLRAFSGSFRTKEETTLDSLQLTISRSTWLKIQIFQWTLSKNNKIIKLPVWTNSWRSRRQWIWLVITSVRIANSIQT